jgi:hypothetical protein
MPSGDSEEDDMPLNQSRRVTYSNRCEWQNDDDNLVSAPEKTMDPLTRLAQAACREIRKQEDTPERRARRARLEQWYNEMKPAFEGFTWEQRRHGVPYLHSVRPIEVRFVPDDAWMNPEVQPPRMQEAMERFYQRHGKSPDEYARKRAMR